jgi:hypothetical protein
MCKYIELFEQVYGIYHQLAAGGRTDWCILPRFPSVLSTRQRYDCSCIYGSDSREAAFHVRLIASGISHEGTAVGSRDGSLCNHKFTIHLFFFSVMCINRYITFNACDRLLSV